MPRAEAENPPQARPAPPGKWRRRLWIMLALLSSVVALAIGGVWARSLWRADSFTIDRQRWDVFSTNRHVGSGASEFRLVWIDGGIGVGWSSFSPAPNAGPQPQPMRSSISTGLDWSSEPVHWPAPDLPGLGLRRIAVSVPQLGFGLEHDEYLGPAGDQVERETNVQVPLWLPFLLAVLVASLSGWRARHWHRRYTHIARGLCPACGYDLRGTPEGEPCPECGTVRS